MRPRRGYIRVSFHTRPRTSTTAAFSGGKIQLLCFGVFFLLLSAVVLLVNLFRMPGGYDWALGLLDLLTFLGGLLLLCFRA